MAWFLSAVHRIMAARSSSFAQYPQDGLDNGPLEQYAAMPPWFRDDRAGGWITCEYVMLPASYVMGVLKLPLLHQRVQKRADKIAAVTGKGPSEKSRAAQRSVAIAVASDATGRQLAAVRVEGPNAYDLTGDQLGRILAKLTRAGFTVGGDRLKTSPRGFDAGHPRIDLLRHRSLTVTKEYGFEPIIHTPQFVDAVRADWRAARPLVEWVAARLGD